MDIWLETDEPRKRFFAAAYPLVTRMTFLVRNGMMSELYDMYEAYMKAYRKLDVRLKLYDRDIVIVNDALEYALRTYCPNDARLNEIYARM